MRYLHLKGLPAPIAFSPEAAGLSELLVSVLKGWPATVSNNPAGSNPFLRVSASAREIRIERLGISWTALELTSVSAVCTLVVEIVDAFVAASPSLGSLHAASAEFGGRVVVFLASHRVGKSTLAVRLSASGRRVFSDDILPVDLAAGEAVTTGCLPRLRLPLPPSATDGFRDFVRARTVLTDGYYCYVDAPEATRTVHAQRAAIGAIVLLERKDDQGGARLDDAALEDAVLNILLRDTRHALDAEKTLSGYCELIKTVKAYRLIYSELEDAVGCLEEAFAAWPNIESPAGAVQVHRQKAVGSLPMTASGWKTELYRRKQSVSLKTVGGAGFLVNPSTNEIHMLNNVGLALWHLLEEPMDQAALVAAISSAFPDTPKETIERDTAVLVRSLCQAGLVIVLTGNGEDPRGSARDEPGGNPRTRISV
jgi:hypothetical protein